MEMQEEEMVLCRIQKTKTGNEVEGEIYVDKNHSSLITNAHHQEEMPQVPVSSVPFEAFEKPGSKRLRRDNSTYNGTQYCSTSTAGMAPPAAATPGYQQYQYQQCYNNSTGVPDHYNHQQQEQQHQQQQQQQQQHDLSNACAPVAPPSSSMRPEENEDDDNNEFLRTINQFKKFT